MKEKDIILDTSTTTLIYNNYLIETSPNEFVNLKDVIQTNKWLQEKYTNLFEINKKQANLIINLTKKTENAIKCINHYAIEDEDYSKIYNDEEKELLSILESKGE